MVRRTKTESGTEFPSGERIRMVDLFKENLWLIPAMGATLLVVLAILAI
jgi:hypothetical protein